MGLHIGLIIYGRLDTRSGGYLYDHMLVQHLRQQGDTVDLISLPWSHYGRHLTHNLSRPLTNHLRNGRWHILLQDELNHPSLFWLNRRLTARPYPIISIVHHLRSSEQHPRPLLALYGRIEQAYLRSVDGFICNSHTTHQAITARTNRTRPTLIARPAGDRFTPTLTAAQITTRAHQPGPLRLLFVGNVTPRKGLHTLIQALCQLDASLWQLDVVGDTAVDPTYTHRLQRQIQQATLEQNIQWHGRLPDPALATQMTHSHLLALPSQYEGFGIVYLEGMAFGLPALGSLAGAAHEIITPGQTGYLVAPGDAATLAQHIHHLAHNRSALAQMALAAQQRYHAQPTWAQSMAQIRTFLLANRGHHS